MRIKEKRFSVPFCILKDNLPDCAIRALLVLLSKTDFNGSCVVPYSEFKKFGLHADNTITKAIHILERKDWIFFRKKVYGRPQTFFLKIPDKYRKPEKPKTSPLKVVK